MDVAQITVSVSYAGGGVSLAVAGLAKALADGGCGVRVDGIADGGEQLDFRGNVHVKTHTAQRRFPIVTSPAMEMELSRVNCSLFHLHGLWTYPSLILPRLAERRGLPRIISPHGMLDRWALRNAKWKKGLAGLVFEKRNLRSAACLHALCSSEVESIRNYGMANPICVIPNGVDIPADAESEIEGVIERKAMLFFGRLHPKKGLSNAIRAWSKECRASHSEEWQLIITGWDQSGHEAELKHLCDELCLSHASVSVADFLKRPPHAAVVFTGPAFGEQKDRMLRRADAFILPSFSEGLPMAVLEAWAYRLPVLMTDHCNLPEGFAADAAIRIGTDVESIAEGMRLVINSSASCLSALGLNGRALVERRFSWPQVAVQMEAVYEWVLGGGDRPDSVRCI